MTEEAKKHFEQRNQRKEWAMKERLKMEKKPPKKYFYIYDLCKKYLTEENFKKLREFALDKVNLDVPLDDQFKMPLDKEPFNLHDLADKCGVNYYAIDANMADEMYVLDKNSGRVVGCRLMECDPERCSNIEAPLNTFSRVVFEYENGEVFEMSGSAHQALIWGYVFAAEYYAQHDYYSTEYDPKIPFKMPRRGLLLNKTALAIIAKFTAELKVMCSDVGILFLPWGDNPVVPIPSDEEVESILNMYHVPREPYFPSDGARIGWQNAWFTYWAYAGVTYRSGFGGWKSTNTTRLAYGDSFGGGARSVMWYGYETIFPLQGEETLLKGEPPNYMPIPKKTKDLKKEDLGRLLNPFALSEFYHSQNVPLDPVFPCFEAEEESKKWRAELKAKGDPCYWFDEVYSACLKDKPEVRDRSDRYAKCRQEPTNEDAEGAEESAEDA